MTWRADGSSEAEDRRVCPTCRTRSNYVIPSWEYCVGEAKEQVMDKYKAKLATIPCKKFNGNYGSCPFGRECFYAHLVDDEDVKRFDKTIEEIQRNREAKRRQARYEHDLDIMYNFLMLLELMGDFSDSEDEEEEF